MVRRTAVTALIAGLVGLAGPARADTNNQTSSRQPCPMTIGGVPTVFSHGSSFTFYNHSDKKYYTYTCNNGHWDITTSTFTSPAGSRAGVAVPVGTFEVLSSGAGVFTPAPGADVRLLAP